MKNGIRKRKAALSTLASLPLYLFTLVFVLGPLILMIALSFSTRDGWDYTSVFTLENYAEVFSGMYLKTFAESLELALISTILVVLIGYPFGLAAAMLPKKMSRFIYTMQVIPYWVNSLLRLYGWIIIFRANGLLDKLLMAVGLTSEPLKLLYTYPAVVVGMVYVLLPFMFTSVYQVAEKLDPTLIEASRDLGAGKIKAFLTVTLPLTRPGLATGIVLTFIPSMGLFFIASILGGNKVVLVGSLIEELLMKSHNKPGAAALASVLMLLTAAVCALLLRKPKHER
ncbi:MAG: ABC transporter permease [Ruminococcaceae bacterium]|nr:ABC transporter permease [Oscillospiraceae bacterium]